MLLYFRTGCLEKQITGCEANLLKEPTFSLERNGDCCQFLEGGELRNGMFNALHYQSLLYVLHAWPESVGISVTFRSSTYLQSI